MEGLVEENGAPPSLDPLGPPPAPEQVQQYLVQSVIQPTQQSVIQSATNIPMQISKGNVILLSKPTNSVIHTTQGSLQTLQIKPEPTTLMTTPMHMAESNSDDNSEFSDEESPKKRRDLLTRRPSYRKILNDLGGGEIAVIPAGALQISSGQDSPLLTMQGGTGATIVQYTSGQDGQFFVPVAQSGTLSGSVLGEDQNRKREMRLLKNREAARECRRKKKEYIKCLENRVAVLENQNKTLIDELKSLKELYCQQKAE
ncbi:cyclic AMP response element-binding protein B-like isoform X3 [Ctenocephalides felis]|uniref:cyclic AMP response element-binding protein B-like isoform X3 n=1 Tax=Ctenocephalides felis TaxID=7515 RepID=UPI000E6E360B|nr:cyclic AMP response element-binding protein B-like isoform X3 [Ctenocephalides felis]XP_026465800.1 cyclic AMP response element-binding protein B-like isoform X3 [Ctenocephalides felis]